MTQITFLARGDGSSAGNPNLNVDPLSQQPTIEITFDSGDGGDIILDYPPGGGPDPDTILVIDGVEYEFTVELVGDLPLNNGKVPDALEGRTVVVISYIDSNGDYQRLWFVVGEPPATLAQMNAFGNGAITLENVTLTPPTTEVCFCAGTEILTPSGYRKVETLRAGDFVLNDRSEAKQLMWVGCSRVSLASLRAHPNLRPIRILAGAIAPGCPEADLLVSPQHRVVIEGPAAELMFGEERVLVAAKHLAGSLADVVPPEAEVSYYHLLLEDHEILVSNGLHSESFQPARRTIDAMSEENQALLVEVLEALGAEEMLARKDALLSLKRHEALVLADAVARGTAAVPAATAARASVAAS